MRRFDSSLPPCGPSPSELVAAFTIATSHPGGVSRRKRACPSGVNAQFRELAARSITSRRSSVNVHPVDVLAPEQRRGRDLELPRRTRELELEGAVFRMIEDTLRFDVDAVSVERRTYVLSRHIHAGANGGARRASGASHPVLQAAESGEHEGDEEARLHSLDVESSAHRHPDRGDDPDRRRRGEPGDHSPRLHDGAGAEEANPADDLSRDAPRVADPPSIGDADPYGDVHQQRGADADENIGAQASGFAGQLTLEADDPAEEDSEPELDEEVEAQYAYDFHHLWNVHVRRWRRQNGGLPPAILTSPAPDMNVPQMMEVVRVLRLDLLVKLGLAVLLGGIIGFERELSGKPAGLRTNILICIGAALLMDVSIRIGIADGRRIGDPGRIAAQIVSGVGFLGAGTIMQARGMVTGLTSAATIWVVAAIGMAVGAGFYVEGMEAGLLVTFVLAGLGSLEHWVRRARLTASATIRARVDMSAEDIRTALHAHGINVESQRIFDHPEDRTFELKLSGPARQFEIATASLLGREDIYGVHV